MNMKKLGLFAISLMSVSFLASCVNRSSTHTIHIEHDEHCTVSADTLIGNAGSVQVFTIDTFLGYDLANDGLNFVNEQGAAITYDGDANYNYETQEISVKIGNGDATLKCTTDVAYQVDIIKDHCETTKEFISGPTGSTRSFKVTADDGYVFSENKLMFTNEEGPITYDGNVLYDDLNGTVTVTIGSNDAKLVCSASKLYTIDLLFTNCKPSTAITQIEGLKGYSKIFNIKVDEGYILNDDSFTWVDQQGEVIDDYTGSFVFNSSYQTINISVGDGNATLKLTAFKLHTIMIDTSNCTANKPKIIDINSAKVDFTLTPDKERGYIFDDSCFSWVDDESQVIDDYDGDYEYDEDNNTMTVTVGSRDVTLKCVAKLRTSTITIKTSGNCSAEALEVSGTIGETKTFKLNVTGGNTVSFAFAPDTTGATYSYVDDTVTVTIGNDDAILDCYTTLITYTWNLSSTLGVWIPSFYQQISGSVGTKVEVYCYLNEGYVFTDSPLTFSPADTKTTYEFKNDNLIEITFGVGSGTITFNTVQRWYKYHDWWNHCSSGNEQATTNDIGKTVPVVLNGITHKVRLIDIDHDYLASDNTKYAHCTFELANVVTNTDGTPYTTVWSESDAHKFIDYNLYDTLNTGGDVYKMLPTGEGSLMNKLVNVTKYVGDGEYFSWSSLVFISYNIPYNTKLFPLSFHEIVNMNHHDDALNNEGYIYSYYKNITNTEPNVDRMKSVCDGSKYYNYYLRSPVSYGGLYDRQCWYVGSDGSVMKTNKDAKAVSFAFCI